MLLFLILRFQNPIIQSYHIPIFLINPMFNKAKQNYYSLILMDIQMPIMNGYEASRRIRELKDGNKSQIPIVAMTANAFEEDKKMALASGMNDHVAKPIDMNVLLPTIMKYM